ncbi:MAG: hypothetical protein K0S70_793 [Microbacterium sp.]|nr:hypothetical protein [Microbacterium sp.]
MSGYGDLDELTDVEASVTPASVRQWLAAERWSLVQSNDNVAEVWSRPDSQLRSPIKAVMLPLATDYVDYGRRFKSVLEDLRRLYGLSMVDLVQEIASVSTDIFLVRLDQTTIDGTIPFRQATALLTSIQKMVRAAATTAANPDHSHAGRRPAGVNRFLEDDLRFGHTKRGSFIITVAAKLDGPDTPELGGQVVLDSESQVVDTPLKPFSRRVMETLASGLTATKRHLSEGADLVSYEDFESARVDGMSYELVQSLLDVSDVEGVRSVDMSFQWATSGPPPALPDAEVTIKSSELDRLEEVRNRLKKVDVPEEQTLTGRVTDLSREELGGGQEERSILMEAELNGGLKKVKIPLTTTEYDWAIWAHQRRLLLTVTGTPVRRGRWVMEGTIQVDTRFLEIAKREEEESGRTPPE